MRMPSFNQTERRTVADPVTGRTVVLERQPNESLQSFEARQAAALHAGPPPTAGAQDLAYREGRRDQHQAERRAHRGGFGLIGLVVVIVAALGVLWIVLAAREGSFAAGGALVDQKIAQATAPAREAANQAADRTGKALENVGQSVEEQGERIRRKAQ